MAESIARALARVKADVRAVLPDEAVERACRAAGHEWRERVLGPVQTLHLFVLQVLHLNTAIRHLRHLAGFAVNAAAYCEARQRLPLAALQSLLRGSSDAASAGRRGGGGGGGLWHGLRALLVDGSSTIAPDAPGLQEAFGQPKGQKAGCGFPVPTVLGLFDALSGLVVQMLCFPLYTHEAGKAARLHPLLGAGDLVVGDRGFCSFAHLALLRMREALACFRMHQKVIVDFRPRRRPGGKGRPKSRFVRRLGRWDQLVWWPKPKSRPDWMPAEQYAALPGALLVRELRYRIPRRGQRTLCVTIATTLLDPALYPKGEVAELYGLRWTVETHFAELKTTLRMRKVKCRTPDGVRKELAVYCLVYNLVRSAVLEAARRQGVDPLRISFLDAVRWLQSAAPGEAAPALVVNPRRPGRHEPRVIKDLQDTYTKMTRPRAELRRELRKGRKSKGVKA